ncbi:MAG TPA: hypothetical protein VKU77_22785 [Streptosporangiaceae bacterium]|nr:hypothetical protein [Streptosporangiaceae bacterium]
MEFERGAEILSRQRPILGCPLNNLVQEMNPLDDGFRTRTSAVFDLWRTTWPATRGTRPTSGPAPAACAATWTPCAPAYLSFATKGFP